MPIHDWTRVSAGAYHDFHCMWIPEIKRALNGGVLPEGYYAMTEQHGHTVTIRHESDDGIVALIEILSPSNKDRRQSVERFVRKCWSAIDAGFHLLIVDLFPPNDHCPHGMHAEIWSGYVGEPIEPPAGKPLVAASYDAGVPATAYYQPLVVGDEVPTMPLFIEPQTYVELPLAETYDRAFENMASQIQEMLIVGS